MIGLTQRQGCLHLYARQSTEEQRKNHNGCKVQLAALREAAPAIAKRFGLAKGFTFEEPTGVSATDYSLDNRPAGAQMIAMLKPGDVILVTQDDRLWRKLADHTRVMELLRQAKCQYMSLANQWGGPVNYESGDERVMSQVKAVFAEYDTWNRRTKSLEGKTYGRSKGLRTNNDCLHGMRYVDKRIDGKIKKALAWDPEARKLMGFVVHQRDEEGLGYAAIARMLNEYMKRAGRGWKCTLKRKKWIDMTVSKLYEAEKYYQDHNITDPCQLPHTGSVRKAMRQHSVANGYNRGHLYNSRQANESEKVDRLLETVPPGLGRDDTEHVSAH